MGGVSLDDGCVYIKKFVRWQCTKTFIMWILCLINVTIMHALWGKINFGVDKFLCVENILLYYKRMDGHKAFIK